MSPLLKLLYKPSNMGSMLPVKRSVAKVEGYLKEVESKVSLRRGDSAEHESTHAWTAQKIQRGATPRNMSPRIDGKEKSKRDDLRNRSPRMDCIKKNAKG
jgi:hypothetical protein